MRVRCAYCQECQELVFSRSRHDFRYCKCRETFIDGGFDYIKTNSFFTPMVDISQTKDEISRDYLTGNTKYGRMSLSEIRFDMKQLKKNIKRILK